MGSGDRRLEAGGEPRWEVWIRAAGEGCPDGQERLCIWHALGLVVLNYLVSRARGRATFCWPTCPTGGPLTGHLPSHLKGSRAARCAPNAGVIEGLQQAGAGCVGLHPGQQTEASARTAGHPPWGPTLTDLGCLRTHDKLLCAAHRRAVSPTSPVRPEFPVYEIKSNLLWDLCPHVGKRWWNSLAL